MKLAAMAAVVVSTVSIAVAPPASATMYLGNYMLNMPDRRDFHTWIFSALVPCYNPDGDQVSLTECIHVLTIPQPVAKADSNKADARLVNGQYSMTIDEDMGLRCGDIYYGPTIPTRDVYTWDASTLAGQMTSTFDAGCDGAPGGSLTYPFSLSRM
ncbi:hypothetical protein ABIA30_003327 [Mycobacterium sp. MAA66]|jgi:hypothetical protein|uniref:hypothetical protein n=1 Tax=Mycobacterium sp. MAA66 TaxID=3156297 RepID=UPI003519B4B4